MMLPTVIRGFSDAYGSWKIICMRRRILRICSPPSLVSSTPSNFTSPAVGLYSWRIARPVVDFPQPDSPTRPSVSLFSTKKSMPSTARTAPTWRWKMIPCVSGKCIFSAFTSSRFLPLSNVAVERLRWMNSSFCTVMSLSLWARRGLARRFDALHLGGQVRDFHLDRLERLQVPDVPPPVRAHEPTTLLGAPAACLVIRLRVRDVLELRWCGP